MIVKKYLDSCFKAFDHPSAKNDWYYSNVYDFLLKEGSYFDSKTLNKDELYQVEEMIYKFIKAHGKPKKKQCYYNSQMVALMNDSFQYIEGVCLSDVGLPIQHGFLLLNNKVIDLTWTNDKEEYVIGEHSREYYGIPFLITDVRRACLKTLMWNSHLEPYWNNGLLFKNKFVKNKPYLSFKTPLK